MADSKQISVDGEHVSCAMIRTMSVRTHIFAFAAFALLFAAGADLLIVDLFTPFVCDSQTSGLDDDCFCCCAHIVVPAAPVHIPAEPVQVAELSLRPLFFSQDPPDVYHPPRA